MYRSIYQNWWWIQTCNNSLWFISVSVFFLTFVRWWLTAGRNLWFLFSSRSQVVNFLKWKHHHLSENIAIFHSNYDLFTQYIFLNEKRCHLMTFSWRVGSERTKARGKRNHKFRASLSKYWIFSKLVYLRSFF